MILGKFFKRKKSDRVVFTIKVTMEKRWVPHFLAMLKYMQKLGSLGSSRRVALYSDGDGDFCPKFKWSKKLPSAAIPIEDNNGNRLYDAG